MIKKVKMKKVKLPAGEGLTEMFNQMIGAGSLDLGIVYPKYARLRNLSSKIITLCKMLADAKFLQTDEFRPHVHEITRFCAQAAAQTTELFSVDLSKYEWCLSNVPAPLKEQFERAYADMKKSDLINMYIQICDRLILYKKHYSATEPATRFINAIPVEWKPFPFTTLDLKYVCDFYADAGDVQSARIREFIVLITSKAYELTRAVYDEIQAPDIDIDQFVEVIMANIDELQKQPALSRCGGAFKKIKESVQLLKSRIGSYYRDFLTTTDSSIMLQHFIIDVSQSTTADARVTLQFKKIIEYYRKRAAEQITDPRVKEMMEKMRGAFDYINRNTENMTRADVRAGSGSGSDSTDTSDDSADMTEKK